MKRCPTCNKTFSDELVYCVDDGTPLLVDAPGDETTVVRPSPASADDALRAGPAAEPGTPAYQPPRPYTPPDYPAPEKRVSWLAVVGIVLVVLLIVAGMGVAAAVFVPRMLKASINSRNPSPNFNGASNANSNASETAENSNVNNNAQVDDTTPPPTDQNQALADLRDLEDEWTVANINADKKKLNRILADDYVGVTNGRSQGKAEYLKTIERDTSIQRWEFGDLKVSLNHDRAILTGVIKLDVKDSKGEQAERMFHFTDKFVWRDARWQATGSEVSELAEKPDTTN